MRRASVRFPRTEDGWAHSRRSQPGRHANWASQLGRLPSDSRPSRQSTLLRGTVGCANRAYLPAAGGWDGRNGKRVEAKSSLIDQSQTADKPTADFGTPSNKRRDPGSGQVIRRRPAARGQSPILCSVLSPISLFPISLFLEPEPNGSSHHVNLPEPSIGQTSTTRPSSWTCIWRYRLQVVHEWLGSR